MVLLDYILVAMQLATIYQLARSSIWSSDRHAIECLKVIYFSIGTVAILTSGVVVVAGVTGMLDTIPKYLRFGGITLLALYSLITYHVVYTINTSRLVRRIRAPR